MHLKSVLMQCLRVILPEREWWIDLPELISIQLGKDTFCFEYSCKASELIMRSEHTNVNWGLDLPKLTSLITEGRESQAFHNPRSISLEGMSCYSSSPTDIPSLTTVTLTKGYAFSRKETLHTKSLSPSSPSFLDITRLLQTFLEFPLSFTQYSFS